MNQFERASLCPYLKTSSSAWLCQTAGDMNRGTWSLTGSTLLLFAVLRVQSVVVQGLPCCFFTVEVLPAIVRGDWTFG